MRVYLIAGEASGDKLGASLMAGLAELAEPTDFQGVGGSLMQAQGLTSLFDMTELSVMGIAEILPKYRHLKRRIKQTAQDVVAAKPDVLITIDSPEFCLRVARQVKQMSSIRTVHYVAPSVWAWRPGRAKKMAGWVDQVLALLPFEPPYMEAAGMRCDFVGHPVVSEPRPSQADVDAFRRQYGITDAPLVAVLPGSRQHEVSRLGPTFGAAIQQTLHSRPDAQIMVVAARPVVHTVRKLLSNWSSSPIIVDPTHLSPTQAETEKRVAFLAADIALAASGTVSLELAAASTPMVIAYDVNWLSRQIMSRLIKIDSLTLVNLVSGSRAVPEYLGKDCRPGPIADALVSLLSDPEVRQQQYLAMAKTMNALGKDDRDPGLRAASAVLSGLNTAG